MQGALEKGETATNSVIPTFTVKDVCYKFGKFNGVEMNLTSRDFLTLI
jgi:hypothetical protein